MYIFLITLLPPFHISIPPWTVASKLKSPNYYKSAGNCNVRKGTLRYIKKTLSAWTRRRTLREPPCPACARRWCHKWAVCTRPGGRVLEAACGPAHPAHPHRHQEPASRLPFSRYNRFYVNKAVFWIRIETSIFCQCRSGYGSGSRSRVLMAKNWKKFTAEIFLFFLLIKNCNLLIPRPP